MQWQPRQKSDWAESIGGALNSLADYKLQSMLQEKQQQRFKHQNALGISQATGIPFHEALNIAGLAPQAQGAYIKAHGAGGNPEAEKESIAAVYGENYPQSTITTQRGNQRPTITSAIDNIGYTPQEQTQKPLIPTALFNQNQQPNRKQQEAEQIFPKGEQIENSLKKLANPFYQENKGPSFSEEKKAIKEIAKAEAEAEKPQYIAPPTSRPPISPVGLTPEQYRKRLVERHALEKEDAKEGEEFWKDRLASKESLPQEEHAIKEMLKIRQKRELPPAKEWKLLTELEENSKKNIEAAAATGTALGASVGGAAGLLGGPAIIPAITGGGLIGGSVGTLVGYIGSLYAGYKKSLLREGNPDIARYEKYAATLVKQIPKTFKGTISEAVLTSYMDTIPTLSVDNEGSIKILEDLESGIQLTKKLNATADNVYEQNGHKIPKGFQHTVLKKHEKAVEDWINGLEETIQYSQSLAVPQQ